MTKLMSWCRSGLEEPRQKEEEEQEEREEEESPGTPQDTAKSAANPDKKQEKEEEEEGEQEKKEEEEHRPAVGVLVAPEVGPGVQLTLSQEGEELGDLLQGGRRREQVMKLKNETPSS